MPQLQTPRELLERRAQESMDEGVQTVPEALRQIEILSPLNSGSVTGTTPTTTDIPEKQRLPAALKLVNLDDIRNRSDLHAALCGNLPKNEYGLPKFIYRCDILDVSLFEGNSRPDSDSLSLSDPTDRYEAMQDQLNCAMLPISYHEGFPTLPDNQPFWGSLEFESPEAHAAFKAYIALPGARQLSLLSGFPPNNIKEWFHIYYWGLRARAYDAFAVVHHDRVREQRIMSSTDKQFLTTESLLTRLTRQLETIEFSDITDPSELINLYEKLAKIQRTSLGLPANGNATPHQPQSLEVSAIMKKVTHVDNADVQDISEGIDTRQLLTDVDSIDAAQEMILKVTSK